MPHKFLTLNRLLLVVSISAIVIFLVGCTSSPTATPSFTPIATQTPTVTPTISASISATPSASPGVSPTATVTSSPTPSTSPPATPTPSGTPAASPTPTPTSSVAGPTAFIVSPLYNVTIPPGNVAVNIVVTNFNIVNKIGQPNVSGEGHVIYYLDVTPPTIAGQPATTAAGTYAEITGTSYTWTNVAAGLHTFSIQLVNNDGTPLNPTSYETEPVPVVAPTPSTTPTATTTPSTTSTP